MTDRASPRALIAGVHEFPERKTAKSALEIQALSARAALVDAGLGPRDVDGFFTVAGSGATGVLPVVDYLNLNPRYVDGTTIGGASFVAHASHAAAAIAAGRCRVALVTYGSTARSQGVAIGTRARAGGDYVDQFEAIHGVSIAALYALVAQRHMHVYGTTGAQLAAIAVACRRHAGLNPDALYREPFTVADVLASPMIASPLHLFDCCVITDGGGAVVLVHPDLARDLPKPPVAVLGSAEAVAHTGGGGARLPRLGGALPVNTDGGGLSSNHPGMRGIFLIIEAVRQLRGEGGPRQVPDCRLALVHGTGGALGTRHAGATLVLGRR